MKEKKKEGWNVRQGTEKVWFKGIWCRWENRKEIERDMERERKNENRFCMGEIESEKGSEDREKGNKDL